MKRFKHDLAWVLIWVLIFQMLFPSSASPVHADALPAADAALEPSSLGLSDLRIVRVHEIDPAAPREPFPVLTAYGPSLPDIAPPTLPPLQVLPSARPPVLPQAAPMYEPIPFSLLAVSVFGPPVASLGSPMGAGEWYTIVVRNDSVSTAYNFYLTATHESYFIYDGGDALTHSVSGTLATDIIFTSDTITWTPTDPANLAPGEVITLTFRLRAACDAQSGQRLEASIWYNANPNDPPVERNFSGLNITTGRGNMVITKAPPIQDLGTPNFGQPITWTITVQNTGLGKLYNAVITDAGGISLDPPTLTPPTTTIPVLDVNETFVYTAVGTVEACNLTNDVFGSWQCGNQVGDATAANPLSSTVSILYNPEIPNVQAQVSSPILFEYCAAVTRTVTITLDSLGGPAGLFRLDSTLESDGFLEMVPGSLSGDWTYSGGLFSYTGGSPAGAIPGSMGGLTLTFQVRPQDPFICSAGSGQIVFTPLYQDVCGGNPFTGTPALLNYLYAYDIGPELAVEKDGPGLVNVGQTFSYTVTVSGQYLDGQPVYITDTLPGEFEFVGPLTPSAGSAISTALGISWQFTPTATPFSETLVYWVRAITTTGGVCGASQIVDNGVAASAQPPCPECPPLQRNDQVSTAIQNNEGVSSNRTSAGAFEVCDAQGFVITNTYQVTGTTTITWTGAVFTEALGTPIGGGALPGAGLEYIPGSLSVVINGVEYVTLPLTPVVTAGGQLMIDLSPLQAAGAPTQTLAMTITYRVRIPESALNGEVEQTFYDWTQLYLPGVSDEEACAGNNSFNQALVLTISRGDLSISLAPAILDRCGPNRAIITVQDNQPDRVTDHVVVTFTASSAEIASARGFTYTGGLLALGAPTVISNTDIGGGRGMITFTFPAGADLNGNGEIHFDVDIGCTGESPWAAGVTFESLCGFAHGDDTALPHVYRAPNLLLFATPIRYTVRDKEVLWRFFIANNGNLTAANVLITNTISGLAVFSYTVNDASGVSLLTSLPVTGTPGAAVIGWNIDELAPNEQRAFTVTAQVVACTPLGVDIDARLDCLGETCQLASAQVDFNTPDPYLLTNNGQSADLPMCDLGQVMFTTKNASADVTLYHLDITETMRSLFPAPGEPITMVIEAPDGTPLVTTTAFVPITQTVGDEYRLIWRAVDAPAEVYTWFNALPPLHVVRIWVPVNTTCLPNTSPQSWASAAALAPCDRQLSYDEDAVTFNTLQPDMTLLKRSSTDGVNWAERAYATPGEAVYWRLDVQNRFSARSYVAENVVLTDTWPANFHFGSATPGYTVDWASRTITWTLGDVPPGAAALTFYITGTITEEVDACAESNLNRASLRYGCDDGCTSTNVPFDTADVWTVPDLSVFVEPVPIPLCGGSVPIRIRNNGSRAYSTTLTVTLPGGYYVYSYTVSSGLTPTLVYSTPADSPRFVWDEIPGRSMTEPYEFVLVLHIDNSESGGECPNADGLPVTATLHYDNHPICAAPGPWTIIHFASLDVLEPELVISKLPRTQTRDVGETITWTLIVTNVGTGIAENVLITDVAGSNFTVLGATPGAPGGDVAVVDGNTVTWTLASPIPVGGVWTAQVSALMLSFGDNRNVVTATATCAVGCQSAWTNDTSYTTLLQDFRKNPDVQTGTIGSLLVFTFTSTLPDVDGLYEDLTITDTLPAGLGYVASELIYTVDSDGSSGGPTTIVTTLPTIVPALYGSGPVVWQLGDQPGIVQINGVITAVIQNAAAAFDGARLVNDLRMTYTDDGQPYVYTDTADVDVLEPNLVLDKRLTSSTGSVINLDGTAQLTYTLLITSNGSSPAYDVLIIDAVPSGLYVTGIAGGDSRSPTTAHPLTWTFAVIPPNTTVAVTYTAYISGASPAVNVTNIATVTWTSLQTDTLGQERTGEDGPGGLLDDYADEDSETLTTAGLTFDKQVDPPSTTDAPLRVGDVVTYTIVTIVPPGIYVPWPFQYDDLPAGVRYVVGTFNVTSTMPFIGADPLASAASYDSRPNGVVGDSSTSNPRVGDSEASVVTETVEWWFDPLDNRASATPGYVTVTFQAQLTGIGRNGVVQWTNPQNADILNNTARLYWNDSDGGMYDYSQPTQTLNDTVSSYVGQPLLHINKTYITPPGCSATLLEDAFNRVTTSPPTGWLNTAGTWNTDGTIGYAQQTSASATNRLMIRSGFTAGDFSYSAMVRSIDANSSRGLVFRYTANNYYRVRLRQGDGGNNIQLEEVTAGAVVALQTWATTPVVNQWYHVEARVETVPTGVRIRVYIDGQPYFDVIDTTPRPAGSVGFYANNCVASQCHFDDAYVTRLEETSCYIGANDLVTYTLTISNQGYMPAYDIVVSDVLPAELTFVSSALLSPPTPANSAFVLQPVAGDTGTLVWVVDVLSGTSPAAFNYANQKTLQIQVVARVTDTVAANTRFSNQVFLPYYDSQPGDGPTGTPISSGTDADQRTYADGSHSAGLQTIDGGIAKFGLFDPPPTATLGTLITYTLVVPAQPISATLYGVQITDTVDGRLSVESVDTAGGTGGASGWAGQMVTASFASIPHGTQATITVTARISDPLGAVDGDVILNIGSMSHDASTGITQTDQITTPVYEPLVGVSKVGAVTDDPQRAVYTLTVVNNGNSAAYSMLVTDTLPAGLTPIDISNGGVWSPAGRTITWTIPALDVPPPPANTLVLTYSVRLDQAIYQGSQFVNAVLVHNTSLTETIPGVRPYITDTTYPLEWPLGRLGDYVWYDLDNDGVQGTSPGEFPIGGVIIDLYDSTTGEYITSTVTDGSGWYIFEYLPLNVTYTVIISTASYGPGGPLEPYTQTLWTVGAPDTDSNASITQTFGTLPYAITTTLTTVFTEDLTLDYGFVQLVEIGNYVWFDVNNDGLQNDSPINGLGGVTIIITYPDGRVFTTTTTADGYYTFTVPISQVYTITVIADNFLPGGPLEGYTNTLIDAGADDEIDSDGVPVGGGLTIVTPVITENNYSFDFGLIIPNSPAIIKGVTPPTATIGQVVTYTIRVPEPPVSATLENVVVSDALSPWLEILDVDAPGSTLLPEWVPYPAVLTVTYAVIPIGEQRWITVTAAVISDTATPPWQPVAGDQITNTATLSHTNGITSSNEVTVTVVEPQLVIDKISDPPPGSTVVAGQAVTYTVVVTNVGDSPAYRYTFEDELPVGMRGIAPVLIDVTIDGLTVDPGGYVSGYSSASGIFYVEFENWTPLPPGSTLEIVYVAYVDVDVAAGVDLTNIASIGWMSWLPDTMPGPRVYPPVTDTNTVNTGYAVFDLIKEAAPSPVAAGMLLTYTLRVTNTGVARANDVLITDTIPAGTTFVEATPPYSGPDAADVLTWTLGALDVGETRVLTLVVRINSDLIGGEVSNTAWISSSEDITGTDTVTTPISLLSDVTVVKRDDPDPAWPGGTLVYTLVYTNNGPSDALNVLVTDTLPVEVTFVAADPAPASGPNPLVWNLGALPAGASGQIVITTTVNSDVTEPFTNWVTIGTDTPESDTDNNDDDESTDVLVPGLEVVKTVSVGEAVRNMPFTYTIRITNTGQLTIDPLTLVDTLPADFYYTPGTGSPSEPDVWAEPTLIWTNLGALAPGESITVSFGVTATPGITGTYVNVVTATGVVPGGTVTDTDDTSILINDPAVEVEKRIVAVDTDLVAPNYITFTITITNIGVSVIDVLPLVDQYDPYYLGFTDATPYPEQDADDGMVTWNDLTGPAPHGFGRNLAPGESFMITTVFRVVNNIITTTNAATVTDAIDLYDNPANDDDDEVEIGGEEGGVPTPITLLYLRATAEDGAVRVRWATIAELGTVGFDLYRAGSERWEEAGWITYVPATGPGSTYDYLDARVVSGQWYWYWLVERVEGDTEPPQPEAIHGPVSVETRLNWLPYRIYLPLISNNSADRR